MTTYTLTLQALAEKLRSLKRDEVTLDAVASRISATEVDGDSLAPFLNFRAERYTRNLVSRCARFEVIVVCWKPGQRTPIHNHSGQLGWIRVLQGSLEEVTYAAHPLPSLSQTASEACLVAARARLEETGRATHAAGPAVITVDPLRAVHRLGNPGAAGGQDAVSLHVYSNPHDSCLTYDARTGAVRRVQLSFDTIAPGA